MGCRGSKSKKNAYARVAQYQKESWAAERAISRSPLPLDWEGSPPGCISPACLHNLLTDGFYSPYAANPIYLLLIDCRDFEAYSNRHLIISRWHGSLNGISPEKFLTIVLYDDKPRKTVPAASEDDPLARIYHEFTKKNLQPKIVTGGWRSIDTVCNHLTVTTNGKPFSIPWFPVLILPGFLYLGQSEMAINSQILTALRITHVVALSDSVPKRVLPSTNYLVVPLPEEDAGESRINSNKDKVEGPSLTSCTPTLMDFVLEAKSIGGSVLVYCDQGISRAAAIVMVLLMQERWCSLEDAFYYVKEARGVAHPHQKLLEQLLCIEESLFGAPITSIDDLF